MKQKISISLDESLVRSIDKQRCGVSRSAAIERALSGQKRNPEPVGVEND